MKEMACRVDFPARRNAVKAGVDLVQRDTRPTRLRRSRGGRAEFIRWRLTKMNIFDIYPILLYYSSNDLQKLLLCRGGGTGPPATPEQAHACDGGRVDALG